ncbi:MAG: DUF488 domain-containing protein [Microbacter sp.]
MKTKRIYEAPQQEDGMRILVDRLWPRGLTKEKAAIDLWLKEIAPSTELRKWFGHELEKWDKFQQQYKNELTANETAVEKIRKLLERGTVTLVYAAQDERHNEAVVIKAFLNREENPIK